MNGLRDTGACSPLAPGITHAGPGLDGTETRKHGKTSSFPCDRRALCLRVRTIRRRLGVTSERHRRQGPSRGLEGKGVKRGCGPPSRHPCLIVLDHRRRVRGSRWMDQRIAPVVLRVFGRPCPHGTRVRLHGASRVPKVCLAYRCLSTVQPQRSPRLLLMRTRVWSYRRSGARILAPRCAPSTRPNPSLLGCVPRIRSRACGRSCGMIPACRPTCSAHASGRLPWTRANPCSTATSGRIRRHRPHAHAGRLMRGLFFF
jgi:hypothetical protein